MEDIETLIMENKNLIYSITKYFDNYKNKEDLFQSGILGLLAAYKNFDSSYNIKFTTYAYPYILGEMKKLVREDKNIKISRDIIKLNSKIEQTRNMLMQKFLRPVTNKELADYLEIDEYLISEALNSSNPIMSIDEPICIDTKEITLHEVIADKAQDINTLIALKDELMKLNNIEKEIVDKRYFKDLTQTEIAQSLGMSQVQVSRQEQKVLAKLKQKLV